MTSHCSECQFVYESGSRFRCAQCQALHICDTTCTNLEQKYQGILVCSITGKCHGEVMCYTKDSRTEPVSFTNTTTRLPQQFRNSILYTNEIKAIFNKIGVYDLLQDADDLMYNIADLWNEIVEFDLIPNIKRNDKQSVILACLFSVTHGLCNNLNVDIVEPSNIEIITLNKKKKIDKNLKVKRLRYGQKLLRSAFHDVNCIHHPISKVSRIC